MYFPFFTITFTIHTASILKSIKQLLTFSLTLIIIPIANVISKLQYFTSVKLRTKFSCLCYSFRSYLKSTFQANLVFFFFFLASATQIAGDLYGCFKCILNFKDNFCSVSSWLYIFLQQPIFAGPQSCYLKPVLLSTCRFLTSCIQKIEHSESKLSYSGFT